LCSVVADGAAVRRGRTVEEVVSPAPLVPRWYAVVEAVAR